MLGGTGGKLGIGMPGIDGEMGTGVPSFLSITVLDIMCMNDYHSNNRSTSGMDDQQRPPA